MLGLSVDGWCHTCCSVQRAMDMAQIQFPEQQLAEWRWGHCYKTQAKSQMETLVSNHPLSLHLHKPGNTENEERTALYRCAATDQLSPCEACFI